MFVVVEHTVTDQESFWGPQADEFVAKLPREVILHATYASADGGRAVCLWEAQSVDRLRNFLDPATAGMSKNAYLAVDPKRSRNLPGVRLPRKAA